MLNSFFFFFFLKSFNLWRPLLMIVLYHQNKTPISFWCRRRLNPRSLIQPSETLPVELTGTHFFFFFLYIYNLSNKKCVYIIKKRAYVYIYVRRSCLDKYISVTLGPPKQKFLAPPLPLYSQRP